MKAIKRIFSVVDMTVGTPWVNILVFMIPMLVGNFIQQLYNTVDSIIVGKYIGDNALAAVGSAGPILNLIIVLFIGIGIGVSISVSQYFGGKKKQELSNAIGNCISFTMVAYLLVAVIGVLVTRPLLIMLGTPSSILTWCESYLKILFIGSIGAGFYNILSGVLRGLGDSISALLYLIVASILNIILDLLFVVKFGMGVNGVALATVMAQTVSALLCLLKLSRMKDVFDFQFSYIRFNKKESARIIQLGLPTGITHIIMSMAMIVMQSLTNSFGEVLIAANVIIMRVDGFAMLPNISFGTAMTTYAGQNVGAKKYDRVNKGAKQGTIMAVGTSIFITTMILLSGKQLMGLFTNSSSLVDLSMSMMKILAIGYTAVAITQSLSGVMRGAGDTMTPMWISIVTTILIRVPIAYTIVFLTRTIDLPNGRMEGIFISLLISWILGAIITSIYYKKEKWRKYLE